ncbi:DUF3043 domain-containing protein [Agromyces sp. MMS17-SY077]|uniref:DUF3043 domain-containing protein n=1 Tax=Agromyces seonyuensis TaxID=2662446 RepID=A0A6I4P7C5_9MICO|nr:DUF3043 domain-containing protein [Agromyces seonyuensis]MWB99647.1 DUF3043 domain-containing protein [Agromyces seonyuensis]
MTQPTPGDESPAEAPKNDKKGTRTPTRAEQEAARKRPLVPDDRKEAAKKAKSDAAEQRRKYNEGMAAGDERYLPARDKGPQKKFVRHYVDARTSLGELLLPVMLVLVLASLIPVVEVQAYAMIALYVYLLAAIADAIILTFTIKRKLRAKFGTAERGVGWYAAMRGLQMRVLRLPKPQNKRGNYPA